MLKRWIHLKNLVVAYPKTKNDETFALALGLEEISELHSIIEIYQCLVLSTNECERAFSS